MAAKVDTKVDTEVDIEVDTEVDTEVHPSGAQGRTCHMYNNTHRNISLRGCNLPPIQQFQALYYIF